MLFNVGFLKYMSLVSIAVNMISKAAEWERFVTSEESEGGTKITPAEWASLFTVIEQAIMESIGISVKISARTDVENRA